MSNSRCPRLLGNMSGSRVLSGHCCVLNIICLCFFPISQNQFTKADTTYLFNHVHLILSYHGGTSKNGLTDGRLLRARVQLASCDSFPCSEKSKPMVIPKTLTKGQTLKIPYTYTVAFEVNMVLIRTTPGNMFRQPSHYNTAVRLPPLPLPSH